MGLEQFDKNRSGINSSLLKNFKDIFPRLITKLYIYKGKNLVSRGREVFARENDINFIALEEIAVVDGLIAGEAITNQANPITEDKQTKELQLIKTSSVAFTAFISDIGIDLHQDNLFYTIDKPFMQDQTDEERYDVYSDNQMISGTLSKLIGAVDHRLTQSQLEVATKEETVTFTLTAAVLQNSLPNSKVIFVDSTIHNPLPTDKPDFEITSIEVESDQTIMPEYGSFIKPKALIKNAAGILEEIDLDFKANKELLPLQIAPFAKNGKVQFIVQEFNKYINMPWLYAKKFLSANRNIDGYITQGNKAQWAKELSQAVVDMFKLSHAFSTNFSEYRDKDGNIKNEQIGGVALQALEQKDASSAVDAVLINWQYKWGTKKKSQEYIRARQILAASAEWVTSSFSFSKKGTTEAHKSLLSWYLELDHGINKDTKTISLSLKSLKFNFTFEKKHDGTNDLSKPILNIKPLLSQSSTILEETDRFLSYPELDSPISLTPFSTFPGDIDTTRQDFLKYKIGVDITNPKKLANFFINNESSKEKILTIEKTIDTPLFLLKNYRTKQHGSYGYCRIYPESFSAINSVNGKKVVLLKNKNKNVFVNGSCSGMNPNNDGYPVYKEIGTSGRTKYEPTNLLKAIKLDYSVEDLVKKEIKLPISAYDLVIKSYGKEEKVLKDNKYFLYYEGIIIEYKMKTTSSSTKNIKIDYDKGTFNSHITPYLDDLIFKRKYIINDQFRDSLGKSIIKIKNINRLHFSFFLGNYLDIKFNYQYLDEKGIIQKGSTFLPKIVLPSKHDETITKLSVGI